MAAPSKCLVIDASIAFAAGQTQHLSSRRSREFLDEVLKISHRAVMTATLIQEWDSHQSLFASTWRAEMRSRDKIVDLGNVENEQVRQQVRLFKAVLKDLHLVEAALATDKIVVSLDDRAAADLRVDATKHVVWVNAVAEGGHAIYWLRAGAKPKEEWKLGYPS
jgi:hypothetical protein